jgi:hypothetical protein
VLQDTGRLYVITSAMDTRFAIWSTESVDKSSRSDFVSLSDKGALCTQTWIDANGSTVKAPAAQWCSNGIKAGNKTNIAAIAGGIAAGIAFILVAAVVLLCRRRKRQQDKDTAATMPTAAIVSTSNGNSITTATEKASSRAVQESATPHQTSRHHNSGNSSNNGRGRPSLVIILSDKSFTSDQNVTEDVDRDVETGDSISDSTNDVNTASAINRGQDRTVHRLPQQRQEKRDDTTDTTSSTSTNGNRDVAAKSQQQQAATTVSGNKNDSSTTGGVRRGRRASSGTASTSENSKASNSSGLKAMSACVTSAVKAGIDKHGAKAGIVWEGLGQVAEHIPYVRFAYGKYISIYTQHTPAYLLCLIICTAAS